MGIKSIRLASVITLNEEQEADIIKMIEAFNGSHKMGEFLANLLRIASENPEILVAKDGKYETGAVVKLMENLGQTPARYKYMTELNKKMIEMQAKVDALYDMCLEMYTANEAMNQLGFEQKLENMILAQFMVEQQFDKLRRMTGVQSASDPLLSNRLLNYKERSAKTLEYMIKNNEPVLTELKNELKLAEKLQEILGNIQLQAVPATNTAQTASNVHPEHPEHKLIQQPIDIPMQQPASQEMQATQAMQSRLPKPQAMPQLVKQSTPQATPVVKPKLNVNSATESDDDILDLDNSLELQGEFSTNPEDMKALSSFFGDDDI